MLGVGYGKSKPLSSVDFKAVMQGNEPKCAYKQSRGAKLLNLT